MITENRTLHTASTGKTHRRAAPASADPTPETPVQAELASLPTDARSAAPAVPAIRAAGGYVLLPVKGDRSVAAAARPDGDAGGVYKGRRHGAHLLSCLL